MSRPASGRYPAYTSQPRVAGRVWTCSRPPDLQGVGVSPPGGGPGDRFIKIKSS